MRNTILAFNRLDNEISDRLRLKTKDSVWWRAATILAHSGDSWLWAAGVGVVWLLGNRFWHNYAAVLEISIVIQALSVFAIKSLIRRQRPNGDWGGIYRQVDPHSFPSGHATRAMLLLVLALGLGPAWFGLLISVWAPLVALSRVMTGLHYVSDVAGGMILGLVMGLGLLAISPLWVDLLPFLFR